MDEYIHMNYWVEKNSYRNITIIWCLENNYDIYT